MIIPVRCFTCGKVRVWKWGVKRTARPAASSPAADDAGQPPPAPATNAPAPAVVGTSHSGQPPPLALPERERPGRRPSPHLLESDASLSPPLQVIGNKWDTYLELLQAEYSER